MANRPILMLDIDGVLAPFGCRIGPPQGYDFIEVMGGQLLFSDRHPETMARLMRVCDLMWATAWEEQANEYLLEHLGLEDPLPYISYSHILEHKGEGPEVVGARRRMSGIRLDPGVETWKLPWIRQWAEMNKDRPFAWIDDDIREDAVIWAEERTASGVSTLMISTDPAIGFCDSHISQIEDWAIEAAQGFQESS